MARQETKPISIFEEEAAEPLELSKTTVRKYWFIFIYNIIAILWQLYYLYVLLVQYSSYMKYIVSTSLAILLLWSVGLFFFYKKAKAGWYIIFVIALLYTVGRANNIYALFENNNGTEYQWLKLLFTFAAMLAVFILLLQKDVLRLFKINKA